jgi:hypothetical protein
MGGVDLNIARRCGAEQATHYGKGQHLRLMRMLQAQCDASSRALIEQFVGL